MKTVLIAFSKKNKDIVKLNFLLCLDTNAMKILSSKIWINEIFLNCFSLIWAYNLSTQTGIPASKTWIPHLQLRIVSSGSQLLLSNSLLFHLSQRMGFALEICKVRHLKKMFFWWKVKLFCIKVLFSSNLCSTMLWMENYWWND